MADDVFVLQTSGIPLFARCFGGDFCKLHPDHALQTGFLAAMYSFSQESFGQTDLKSVVFKDIRLDFKIDREKEVIMVFANPIGTERIDNQLDQSMKIFLEKYGSKIGLVIKEDTFEGFEEDLLKLNVVNKQSMGVIPLKGRRSFVGRVLRFLRIKR
ncbi:MAG: hypothetical protein ACXAC7_23580 [Candidatus Hodarchaeales archaeon]